MRKLLILLVAASILIPGLVYAHPPGKMFISYNKIKHILSISIPHPVQDVNRHYIKKVIVLRNGKEVFSKDFIGQKSYDMHIVKIPGFVADKGDKLVIIAQCNTAGRRKQAFRVR